MTSVEQNDSQAVPLLSVGAVCEDRGSARREAAGMACESDKELPMPEFWAELSSILAVSLPMAISTLARIAVANTDIAFVGHLPQGAKALAAASYAQTYKEMFNSFILAPGSALNSLCSQALGAGNKPLAGIWLQLAILSTSLLCVPVMLAYLATKMLMTSLTDDPDVPELAYQFNVVSTLVLWPSVTYMVIRQYFQSLEIAKPAMVVSCLTVGFNYYMNTIFVPLDGPVGWGMRGSPFATFLSVVFQLVVFLLYVVAYKGYHRPYWGGWTWECLQQQRVNQFLKMVLPMALGNILENFGAQIISFSTGGLEPASIAANGILFNLWRFLWAFYWGFGLALQIRVGSYLGKGSSEGALLVVKISVCLVACLCFTVGLVSYIFRTQIAQLFTNDEDVVAIVEKTMYAFVLDYFFACIVLCGVNILEAMAQNKPLAIILTTGMWLVHVPFSLTFAYRLPYFANGDQLQGLWLGQTCGELFKLVLMWGYIARIDWKTMSDEAKERSEAMTEPDLLDPLLLGNEAQELRPSTTALPPSPSTPHLPPTPPA